MARVDTQGARRIHGPHRRERVVFEQAASLLHKAARLRLEDGRRQRREAYPTEAIRETIVNAIAHRDYSIAVTDIELSLYSDRLEVISAGRLPNTVTVDKMKLGYRATRNELLKEILRDYGYVEARGMGVRYRIIQGMRQHNNTEPDLIEEQDHFIVRLWKEPRTR